MPFALSLLLVAGLGAARPAAYAASDSPEDLEQEACPEEIAQAPEKAAAAGEEQALGLAADCGVPVEVTSMRGFTERTWALPEGHLRSEYFAVPQWTRNDAGQWVDVDPSLVWDADGSVRSTATVTKVRMSGGGVGPFLTATSPDGGTLSLTWPDALPVPTLDGDTATYVDVLPGVDLTVTAGIDGFSYSLVVHNAEAATNPALGRVAVGITGLGLSVSQNSDGLIEARNGAGELLFIAGSALMWDSSLTDVTPEDGSELAGGLEPDEASPGRVEAMPIELDGSTLAVIPNAEMLSDPAVVYPVVIDPFFVGSKKHWATVHREQSSRGWTNDSAWPRAGGMRVGLCTWPGCGDAWGLWRSAVRFKTGLGGRHILSAKVKMTQTHTGGCGTYPLELWQVKVFTSGVSWNGLDWVEHLETVNVASSNSTGCGTDYPNRTVTFTDSEIRQQIQSNADQDFQTTNFGIQSGGESDRNQWRRISVSDSTLRLEVQHASYPQKPTSLLTHGDACDTSKPGQWLSTGRPTLTGTPKNADGNGRYRLEVHKADGSGMVYSHRSGVLTVNRSVSHTLTSALPDGDYRWRMRTESASSGVPASSYAGWCYFQVDTSPPAMPSAEQLSADPQLGDPVQFRLTGSSDTHRFRYNLSGGSSTTVSASAGAATITVHPPTTSIDHQLQVWALDAADNLSDRYDLWFTTDKDLRVPVAGVWRFDGDRRDDSGHNHHLTLGANAPLTADREGRSGSAIQLDGNSCVASTEAVLRTNQSFTVAAWVRPDPAESPYMAIMSQPGVANTAFRLRKAGGDLWQFVMLSEDSSSPTWFTVNSQEAATGQWQHVAGVFDAAANRMRLYVGGALQGVRDVPSAWDATDPLFVGCSSSGGFPGWDRFDGAIDDLVAYQGVLTDGQIKQLMNGGVPAGEVSRWPLRGNGLDEGPGGHDLTVPPTATWVADSFGRAGGAMRLDGQSCATTGAPAVRTDDSFTVAVSARPFDGGTTPMTVVSQAGEANTAFRLSRTDTNQWSFSVLGSDSSASPGWHTVTAPVDATTGGWQHVLGAYDASAEKITIYVDGVEQGVASGPSVMWRSAHGLRVGCAGTATGAWNFFDGAVHDLRIWRGAATPEQIQAASVKQVAFWGLDGHGLDGWGDHDLTLHGEFEWVDDRFGFPVSALQLDGTGAGWAETAGPVVTTDESFTVSAWVRLESTSAWQTLLAQAGNDEVSFSLTYHPAADRWQFAMPSQDSRSAPAWHYVRSLEAPVVGQWYHLAGVFDLGANEIRFYVNGELQGTTAGPPEPWHVAGELVVGASADTAGGRWDHMNAAVDMVRVYAGVLDERRIADQGVVPVFPFDAGLFE